MTLDLRLEIKNLDFASYFPLHIVLISSSENDNLGSGLLAILFQIYMVTYGMEDVRER